MEGKDPVRKDLFLGGEIFMNRSEIEFCGIKLKNPLIMASGTYGYGEEFLSYYNPKILGGISSKGITRYPKAGNPGVRIWETPSGILNSIGLENPGVEEFVKSYLPKMTKLGTEIFVNLGGNTADEYVEGAEILNDYDFSFIELNISCPNVHQGGMAFCMAWDPCFDVVSRVKKVTKKRLIVKLSPNAPNLIEVAKAAEAGGADGLSLVNTFLGMAIDFDRRKNVFENDYAGLSGPAIKPLALKMVHEVYRNVKIPIIGLGGITSYKDVLEFLMAGASAVQMGTYNFINPYGAMEIIKDLENYLDEKKEEAKNFIGLIK